MDGEGRRSGDVSPTTAGVESDSDGDLDRNPSPPPGNHEPATDTIGDTTYSKHWLFATLTKLIQAVTTEEPRLGREARETPPESDNVDDDLEDDVCRLWDMSTDKDVADFLLEFHSPELLLGVIRASSSPRITEMCVGILGNMACFPEPCNALSQNGDLMQVLLLLLGDPDPPTLLETSRLLLTCLSRPESSRLWLEGIKNTPSVCPNVCFILSSSTNDDLLLKLGEVVDRLFDLDEDLLLAWLSSEGSPASLDPSCGAQPALPGDGQTTADADDETRVFLVPALLEATSQVRQQRGPALEVFAHIWQQISTVEEGVLAMTSRAGEEVRRLLRAVLCHDLCQPDDPAVVLLEQTTALASVAATLSALLPSTRPAVEPGCPSSEDDLQLLSSTLRIVGYLQECTKRPCDEAEGGGGSGRTKSGHSGDTGAELQLLEEILAQLLAIVLSNVTRSELEEAFSQKVLIPDRLPAAVRILVPFYPSVVQHLVDLLEKQHPPVAETLRALLQDPAE